MAEADRIVEKLEGILPGRVTREVSPYLKDWWPLHWFDTGAQGSAIAAVRPVNVDELVALVKFASSNSVTLCTRGGGSSVTGASVPSGGIVVDMGGLDQVLDIDEGNNTVTIQAGAKLNDAEAKLNARRFTLSQFPQSLELATVGGYVSTMGTGQYSTLYGGAEDAVLRLEVVLPTGEVIWTRKRGAPRSSMGPDFAHLFIGAEGTFGIVSAAELRIRKLPKHVWKVAYSFRSFEAAINASRALMELDVRPAVCRAYNEAESVFQFGEQGCVMLVVYHFNSEEVFKTVREEVSEMLEQVSTPANPELVDRWLEKRFNFREEIGTVRKMGFAPETVEFGVKWSRLYELYVDAVTSLERVNGVSGVGAHISHLYDQGACIYFTILFEPRKEVYWKVWETLARVAKTHDATLSHHHGVGILKLRYAKEEIQIDLLERIKQAMDPKGILSRHRIP